MALVDCRLAALSPVDCRPPDLDLQGLRCCVDSSPLAFKLSSSGQSLRCRLRAPAGTSRLRACGWRSLWWYATWLGLGFLRVGLRVGACGCCCSHFWSDGLKSRLARGEGKPRYKYTLRAPRGNTQSEEEKCDGMMQEWQTHCYKRRRPKGAIKAPEGKGLAAEEGAPLRRH